jgi:hypothetical protein
MNQYKIYQAEYAKSKPDAPAYLRPVLTISATSAAEALRIAKQKGVEFPIVGVSDAK